jgi:sRNA-binding carbon storage regulator CsrA
MLNDYVTAKERLKGLQPIHNYPQKPNCNNKKKVRASVLRCDAGQSFWINDDIQIVVLSSYKGVIHIGIEAPSDTRIVKAKLHHKKQSQKYD